MKKGLFKIKTTDIYYFESNMRTLSVCHLGGKTTFTGKISEVEESLSEQSFFQDS
ncbi:MAG: LytTR family transcriptional regulator DNA-binding domain-containing protein [Phascolarctobacterium faecium]|uniref:LytTR family transcriptional regulator DNA-binding domain-containing protein n=1 Tax=Phascolarctobacterium faecium TaxID=33025 RepID=UPI003999FDBA